MVEEGVALLRLRCGRCVEAAASEVSASALLAEAALGSPECLRGSEAAAERLRRLRVGVRVRVRVRLRSAEAAGLRVAEALRLRSASELPWEALRREALLAAEAAATPALGSHRVLRHRPGGRLLVLVVVGAEGVPTVRLCARPVVRREGEVGEGVAQPARGGRLWRRGPSRPRAPPAEARLRSCPWPAAPWPGGAAGPAGTARRWP